MLRTLKVKKIVGSRFGCQKVKKKLLSKGVLKRPRKVKHVFEKGVVKKPRKVKEIIASGTFFVFECFIETRPKGKVDLRVFSQEMVSCATTTNYENASNP